MTKQTSSPPPLKGSKPHDSTPTTKSKSRSIYWIIGGALIALVAVLAIFAWSSGRPEPVTPDASVSETIGQPVERRVMGDPAAPVLIQAYEDYQCPHCQDFTAAMDEPIRTELVAPGIARFEFKNRFVISEDSLVVALAAECAADQNKFWEYHDAVFARIPNDPNMVRPANLKQLALDLGLDTTTFNTCMDDGTYFESLSQEDTDASLSGVNATPTVFINGVKYEGDLSPAAFVAAVKAAAGQ